MLETKHLLVTTDLHNIEVNGYRQQFHFWGNFPFDLTKLKLTYTFKKYLLDF